MGIETVGIGKQEGLFCLNLPEIEGPPPYFKGGCRVLFWSHVWHLIKMLQLVKQLLKAADWGERKGSKDLEGV